MLFECGFVTLNYNNVAILQMVVVRIGYHEPSFENSFESSRFLLFSSCEPQMGKLFNVLCEITSLKLALKF